MTEAAVVVDGVSKRFRLYAERNQSWKAVALKRRRARYEEFWALRDVSFEVPQGSTFGLIGANGSGKSTLLKCLSRILVPERGSMAVQGRLAALLELGSGFHPELTGRENVYLNASILGLSKADVDRRFDEILDFSGVEAFIDQPVKNYSSGMYARLGFSIAINVEPDVLLVDEVLAVGDAVFQRKCEDRFAAFRREGRTVVLVSHSQGAMRALCDHAAWLRNGELASVGPATEVLDSYDRTVFDRDRAQQQREIREGSGEAQVESLELLDEREQPVATVESLAGVRLRMHYTAHETVPRPVFSFAIESPSGQRVWAQNSRDAGVPYPPLPPGPGSVDLHIPALALQPGVFDLSCSILDMGLTQVYDRRLHMLRFDVRAGARPESGGVVALGATWGAPSDGRGAL